LKAALQDDRFKDFRVTVAYARSGPLYRLQDLLQAWRTAGKTSAAILGLDQQGTSKDALELALALFDRVYVTQEAGITFHPKIYLFKGEHHAQAFVGSNNLTVGGTEKNFEAAVQLEFDLPADAAGLATLESAWNELLPASCPATVELSPALLAQLVADNVVLEEKAMRPGAGDSDRATVGFGQRGRRSGLIIRPESPLPKKALVTARKTGTRKAEPVPAVAPAAAPAPAGTAPAGVKPATTRGLAIQIKPHHNGEIFLSVTAALQNPAFFSWPFNGMTTPKKPGNPSYPQLDPDPVVNITVFGAAAEPVLILSGYPLNTVYYEKKSEIRITASRLVDFVPEYSVMIMEQSSAPGVSYEITIHRPDSPDYEAWVAACNQTMPGGGKQPRKYGWF
jgi:hypothetical protein